MLVFSLPRIFFLSATPENLINGVWFRQNLVIQRRKTVDFHNFFLKNPSVKFFYFLRIDVWHQDLTLRFFKSFRILRLKQIYPLNAVSSAFFVRRPLMFSHFAVFSLVYSQASLSFYISFSLIYNGPDGRTVTSICLQCTECVFIQWK